MSDFEDNITTFTRGEMECRQQDLRHLIAAIDEATEAGSVSEYNPKQVEIAATFDDVWQQGRQGKLVISHEPYFNPMALVEVRYLETDYRENAAPSFERLYTLERTNDGDLVVMISDDVLQQTNEIVLNMAMFKQEYAFRADADMMRLAEGSFVRDIDQAIALEEVETQASLRPATDSDIATLRELLKIAVAGGIPESDEDRQWREQQERWEQDTARAHFSRIGGSAWRLMRLQMDSWPRVPYNDL